MGSLFAFADSEPIDMSSSLGCNTARGRTLRGDVEVLSCCHDTTRRLHAAVVPRLQELQPSATGERDSIREPRRRRESVCTGPPDDCWLPPDSTEGARVGRSI